MNFIRKYYPFFIIILILFFTHIDNIINNNGLMIFYGDSYEQMLQFYLGGWERLRQLDFSQWDWSLGYGANYFSHVYYFATSPFFFITLFFDKLVIPYLFIYLNALKILLLYIFSYTWLKQLHTDKLVCVISSIILSFSGWVIFFYNYNLFLDAFLLYPLILYSIELYLVKDKGLFLSLTLGILGIVNYYMLYMFAPFFILYSLFRYFIIYRELDLKVFIKTGLKLIGYVALGLGLSAFILLPSINLILQTPRIQNLANTNYFDLISLTNIYRYLSTLFTPVMERFDPTYYISVNYDKGIGWGGGVSLFNFTIFPLVITFLFRLKDKFHRNAIIFFYIVLLILSIFTFTYRILQGSYDVRWFYMFTLLNVYSLSYSLNEIMNTEFKTKQYIVSTFIPIIIIISLLIVSVFKGFYYDSENLKTLYLVVIFSILLTIIYALSLFYRKRTLLLTIISIEAVICFMIPITIDPPIDPFTFSSYTENLFDNSVINSIKQMDDSFYRIAYFDGKYGSQNNPNSLNYRGTSFYESIYNYEQNDFLDRFRSNWNMPITFGRTNTTLITSVKYFVCDSSIDISPFGFSYLKTIDNFDIYINDYPIGLGYALKDTLNENVFKNLSILNQDRLFLNYIVTKESKNESYTYLNQDTFIKYAENVYDDFYYFDNTFNRDITVYIENLDLPNIEINKIKDSEFYSKFKYWQYFYLSNYLRKDDKINALEIIVNNEYNSSNGFNIYIDSDLSYYDNWYSSIKSDIFQNVEIDRDHITANITITDTKKWVATTVPFDKGWIVKINDKQIEYSKVNLGFIGFELEEGNYTIEMYYEAPLFKNGLLISLASILIYAIIFFRKKI